MTMLPKPDRGGPVIYCDFNVWDEPNSYPLDGAATLRDLRHQGLELTEGLVLKLYMLDARADGTPDNLIVSGIVRWSSSRSRWEAEVDWDTKTSESELMGYESA